MKKLLYLLMLLPLFFATSCNSDEDYPAVDMKITISGVTYHDGSLYTVRGETVQFDNIAVTALNGNDAAVANVTYTCDGVPAGYAEFNPFSSEINTAGLADGSHFIDIGFNLLEVDKTIVYGMCRYRLIVVGAESELPADCEPIGTIVSNITINPQK